ncbi:MAG: hypothetical protein KW804_02955 [Candidatus Doudnabacteria bacterium]|nr:hypothetical protein [Candidatus Doudnabacteria bacterium]
MRVRQLLGNLGRGTTAAAKLGVTPSLISKIKHEGNIPSEALLRRLGRLLALPQDEIEVLVEQASKQRPRERQKRQLVQSGAAVVFVPSSVVDKIRRLQDDIKEHNEWGQMILRQLEEILEEAQEWEGRVLRKYLGHK